MFLARREFGKLLRVYRNCGAERAPRAWIFNPVNYSGVELTQAAMSAGAHGGVAATGHTRSEAIANLRLIEEAAAHA